MTEGIIVKALSGFYYVRTADGSIVECKARGRFRLDGTSPLVGDSVVCSEDFDGHGRIDTVVSRKNWFIRPSVANVDALVFVAANSTPVTDPFLIDRMSVIADAAGCELIICLNKVDLDSGDDLYNIFNAAGFTVVRTSAQTGEGREALLQVMRGKVCAFTGNSGVGKSSVLNLLMPGLNIETGDVSERMGRGKHTTRHVELYNVADDTYVADTPGFASFDIQMVSSIQKEDLQYHFPDFAQHIGNCRFRDCAHLKEPGCALTEAVAAGQVQKSRYESYIKLYELCAQHKFWEYKQNSQA